METETFVVGQEVRLCATGEHSDINKDGTPKMGKVLKVDGDMLLIRRQRPGPLAYKFWTHLSTVSGV